MDVSRTMSPLQPEASEWAVGIVAGWGIVVMSLVVIGSYAFDQPPPKKEDRVVIHASPRPPLEPDAPPPPAGGEPEAKPQPKKEQPKQPKPVEQPKVRNRDPKAPTYPQPVPVPMPPSDPAPAPEPGGEPGGVPGGTPGGEGTGPTPEEKAAIDAYKRQIARFISQHYSVTGTGLDSDELAKRKVKAVVHIDGDLTIVDYEVRSSGFEKFDDAARKALEAVKGKKLPPPPPGYTGTVGPKLNINLICRPGQCD